MSDREDLLEELSRGQDNVRYSKLETLLKLYGFEARTSRSGTSHVVFTHPDMQHHLAIKKKRNQVKGVYVKMALKAIRQLEEGDL